MDLPARRRRRPSGRLAPAAVFVVVFVAVFVFAAGAHGDGTAPVPRIQPINSEFICQLIQS